jgi:hypothetical protein
MQTTPPRCASRRQAEIDAFPPVAFRLPIERLMLSVLLEQHHGEKARTGEAARQHMEGRRSLADLLACPASELLKTTIPPRAASGP